jgi:hypothetical protein
MSTTQTILLIVALEVSHATFFGYAPVWYLASWWELYTCFLAHISITSGMLREERLSRKSLSWFLSLSL